MSYKQEITCPSCQHKHFVDMDMVNVYFQRSKQLEDAFRDIMIQCLKHIPLTKNADQQIAALREHKP